MLVIIYENLAYMLETLASLEYQSVKISRIETISREV